jgi:hypothetical protein
MSVVLNVECGNSEEKILQGRKKGVGLLFKYFRFGLF